MLHCLSFARIVNTFGVGLEFASFSHYPNKQHLLATIDFSSTFALDVCWSHSAEGLLYREFNTALFNRELWLRCKTSGTYNISLGCCRMRSEIIHIGNSAIGYSYLFFIGYSGTKSKINMFSQITRQIMEMYKIDVCCFV